MAPHIAFHRKSPMKFPYRSTAVLVDNETNG